MCFCSIASSCLMGITMSGKWNVCGILLSFPIHSSLLIRSRLFGHTLRILWRNMYLLRPNDGHNLALYRSTAVVPCAAAGSIGDHRPYLVSLAANQWKTTQLSYSLRRIGDVNHNARNFSHSLFDFLLHHLASDIASDKTWHLCFPLEIRNLPNQEEQPLYEAHIRIAVLGISSKQKRGMGISNLCAQK